MRPFRSIAAGAALSVAACGQSPTQPEEVVAVPVTVAAEQADLPTKDDARTGREATVAAKDDRVVDGGTFPFPDDAGGKALAKSLTPRSPVSFPAAGPATPRERNLPGYLKAPSPTLPDGTGNLPRLPIPIAKESRPTPLPDRVPSDLGGVFPQLPPRSELQIGPLTRQESRDVSKPAELPILSNRPVPDRAPFTDPTLEFTAQSAISPMLPLRTQPTGFVRINLPDPFEHVDAAKPRTPVIDDPNRALGSPPPPR
jgi:hypothetical protein